MRRPVPDWKRLGEDAYALIYIVAGGLALGLVTWIVQGVASAFFG
jgi:hypothetical protein